MTGTDLSTPLPGSWLLEVEDLVVEYKLGRGHLPLRAVDGVSLRIAPGETVGLVGESGSGKTTIGRAILGLAPISHGSIAFDGSDITHAGLRQRRQLSSDLQVVFQDPYSSLNPTLTIGQTLAETLRAQGAGRAAAVARTREMLTRAGLTPDAASRYPAHFSGGQRQRIAIARALMAQPRLVICDEPTSSLDLSIQAQILNLLRELQDDFDLSYLFIAHDLAVVRYLSQRIIVLYRGRVMEQGDAATVYKSPAHPYTRTLLAAVPVPDPDEQRARRETIRRTRAKDSAVRGADSGCPFASRCSHSIDICSTTQPSLETTTAGTLVACHRWQELQPEQDPSASETPAEAARPSS
jgi:oligopeptide/dipeptide ABC transporter ATP-binding protein